MSESVSRCPTGFQWFFFFNGGSGSVCIKDGPGSLLISTVAHQEGPSIEDKMRPPELDEDEGDGDEDRDGMYSDYDVFLENDRGPRLYRCKK